MKLFTHNDLDAVGSVILSELAFGNVDYEMHNHSTINDAVKKWVDSDPDDECYIVDISINQELMQEIVDKGLNVKLFDHHVTALEMNNFNNCKVVVNKIINGKEIQTCGTELFFDYLKENGFLTPTKSLEKFVEVVRNYDTWRWNSMGKEGYISKIINDLFYLLGVDDFKSWISYSIGNNEFPNLPEELRNIFNIHQREIDEYINEKSKNIYDVNLCVDDKTLLCGVVFADNYVSELGNRLHNMFPKYDLIAIVDLNSRVISYRTIKTDVDVSAVAKKYGGGGHKKASGSMFDRWVSSMIANSVFNK